MKHRILLFCYFILYWIGIIKLFYWLNRKKQRIVVYHHVIADNEINGSFEQDLVCIPKSLFEKQIAHINKRFKVTTKLFQPNTIVLTFDDGYRCALLAEEVLAKYKNKAYFFIPLNNIDAKLPLWIDIVMLWFSYVPNGKYKILDVEYLLDTQHNRRICFSNVINKLYDCYEKSKLLSNLNQLYEFDKLKISADYIKYRAQGLQLKEINEMKLSGHKIGAHSISHDILSLLCINDLQNDFKKCSSQIGCIYNTKVYAYPYGHRRDVNRVVTNICSKEFDAAVMNEYSYDSTNHTLSRINISFYKNYYEIEAHLSGLVIFIKQVRKYFHSHK